MLFVPRCYVLQGFLFVAVTNGASSVVCACAYHPQHNFVKLNDSIPHLLWVSNASAQHIKQRYNIIIEPNIGSYIWERLCSPFATCDTPGSQVCHISKGKLVVYVPTCKALRVAGGSTRYARSQGRMDWNDRQM